MYIFIYILHLCKTMLKKRVKIFFVIALCQDHDVPMAVMLNVTVFVTEATVKNTRMCALKTVGNLDGRRKNVFQ